MGLPVVTLQGQAHASRVSGSILAAIGLEDLVTTSQHDYVQRAAALAGNLEQLSTLRTTMRERMRGSPLMDAVRFTRDLESAYRSMWQQACAEHSTKIR